VYRARLWAGPPSAREWRRTWLEPKYTRLGRLVPRLPLDDAKIDAKLEAGADVGSEEKGEDEDETEDEAEDEDEDEDEDEAEDEDEDEPKEEEGVLRKWIRCGEQWGTVTFEWGGWGAVARATEP